MRIPLSYPASRRDEVVEDLHGTRVEDPYRWLENLRSPETRGWIDAQNRLTSTFLAGVPERQRIRDRLADLLRYPRYTVPSRRRGRQFWLANDGNQEQDVLVWRDGHVGEPHVLVDPNRLSLDGTVALTGFQASEDGGLVAYGLSRGGSDWQTWSVRDVATGQDLPDRLGWIKFTAIAWLPDGSGFYYSRYDPPPPGTRPEAALRDQKLCLHRLGTRQEDDPIVLESPEHPDWGFMGRVTPDGRWLVVSVWRGTDPRNALLLRDLDAPDGPFLEVRSAFDAAWNWIGNEGSRHWIHTDHDAPRGRIVEIDVANPSPFPQRELVAEGVDAVQTIVRTGDRFVLHTLRDATARLVLHHLDGGLDHEVELPGLGSVSQVRGRPEDGDLLFGFTRFDQPHAVYRYAWNERRLAPLLEPGAAACGGAFVTRQVFVSSPDGTRVPLFLFHRADVDPRGAPTYLTGYGGFGISETPTYASTTRAWVEMGGVHAQACLRGGGEYGEDWHRAGTLASKQNVFDDFIACAEWLVDAGITTRQRLAVGGGSNGGLLVGACMVQRPDLFGAVLPAVGVLDMLRFHLFTIGWAWIADYGDPEDPDDFRTLLAYSPLHNLVPGTAYPATLITTGDHDDRVVPAHSFKFAAALQAAQGGPAPVLIRIETRAGHGAGKPTGKTVEEEADRWAFLVKVLRIDLPPDFPA